MGFFAIARDPAEKGRVQVDVCHLNFWSLSGLLRRTYWCDVGVRVTGQKESVSKLRLFLPFGTQADGASDLHDQITNSQIAELVFGEPVVVSGSSITVGDRVFKVARMPSQHIERHGTLSGATYSVWTITLPEAIGPGEHMYFRVRFEVTNLGRLWISKPRWMGALLDLRVCDVRGAAAVPDWQALQEYILPIPELYTFIILPSWLQLRTVSPPTHYIRPLEGVVWEGYLGRPADRLRRDKFVVYYWRGHGSTDGKPVPVDTRKPFHAFLDLGIDQPALHLGSIFTTAVVVWLGLLAFHLLSPLVDADRLLTPLYVLFLRLWKWAAGLGVLGLLGVAIKVLPKVRAAITQATVVRDLAEKKVFAPKGRK